MRKIRFRYIKENGRATSVTVRCSVKRNTSLISEALRHYQRLQHRTSNSMLIDPIELRRNQCSSTLIDEESHFPNNEDWTKKLLINERIYLENFRYFLSIFIKSIRARSDLFDEKQILCFREIFHEHIEFEENFIEQLKFNAEMTIESRRKTIGQLFLLNKNQFEKQLQCAIKLTLFIKFFSFRPFFQSFRLGSICFDEFLRMPIDHLTNYSTELDLLLKETGDSDDELRRAVDFMREINERIYETKSFESMFSTSDC